MTATPAVLKADAAYIYRLGEYAWHGMDYAEIDWPNGEVQIFRDYRHRVSAARVARREVLTEQPGPHAPADLNPVIWQRGTELRTRRRPNTPAAANTRSA